MRGVSRGLRPQIPATKNPMPHLTLHSAARRLLALTAVVALAGCAAAPTVDQQAAALASTDQTVAVGGTFSYTNDVFVNYHSRHGVALIDLHGFVLRDQEWRVPLASVEFAQLKVDQDEQSASYQIDLPLRPAAQLNDIDHDGQGGIKLYTVAYWSDPFGDRETMYGWPTYLTSLRTDGERGDEVTGGKLVVWSPDAAQQFPSDFGRDNLLFTGDDPLLPLPAGYAVVDLDTRPFTVDRTATPNMPLYEGDALGTKDVSQLSYRNAFGQFFAQARLAYAFNGMPGKQPDWDGLFASIAPRVLQAEADNDARAFFLAMRDFVNGFHDGHTTIYGGDLADEIDDELYGGGYGFAIRELDDGRALVTYVMKDGPAEAAGMREGAELHSLNTTPVAEAAATIVPPTGAFSTERALRYDQLRYLLRAPIGTTAQFSFSNPGGKPQAVELTAVAEQHSLHATSIYRGADPTAAPIEYWVTDSNIGYVRINTNDDDLDLLDDLFRRAMESFEYNDVTGVMVDLRQNSGGTSLDLAGYLTDTPEPLGTLEYFNTASGIFAADGPRDQSSVTSNPYEVGNIALLVGPACFSACELEAYGFSKLTDAIVVGYEPTAGVVAEVSRGSFDLPEGINIQMPTGRYVLPDASLFLEGSGVAPTLRVPFDGKTALSDDDAVYDAAEQALLDSE